MVFMLGQILLIKLANPLGKRMQVVMGQCPMLIEEYFKGSSELYQFYFLDVSSPFSGVFQLHAESEEALACDKGCTQIDCRNSVEFQVVDRGDYAIGRPSDMLHVLHCLTQGATIHIMLQAKNGGSV